MNRQGAKMTKQEAIDSGVKVVATTPRNKYDSEKWGKPAFYHEGEYLPYKPYVPGSYCEKRVCGELGLKAEDNKIAIVVYDEKLCTNKHIWMPLFESDDKDNIAILVYTLDRELIQLERLSDVGTTERMSDNKKDGGVYRLLRLNPNNVKENGAKYVCPNKQQSVKQYPYIPPQLLAKWENREFINTLVITEGYFKAFKACMSGADVVGIGGITMFFDTTTGGMHSDIKRIVMDCGVKNIVFLHDGDCTDISAKALSSKDSSGQPNRDLVERPLSFKQSIDKFWKIHNSELHNVNIYWYYINSNGIPGKPKGLDDLLVAMSGQQQHIVEDLLNPELISPYFIKLKLNTERARLNERFFIDSARNFYQKHKDEIGVSQFLYRGTIYQWDSYEGKLNEIISKELMTLKRIGNDFYQEVNIPTASKDINGNTIYMNGLVHWTRSSIIDDYGKDAIQKISRYFGFVNVPSHNDYQRVVQRFYNLYKPLMFQPSEDDLRRVGWGTIYSTMEHIFGKDNRGRNLHPGDEEYDPNSQYDIGMDYVQLLYRNPTQNLPILCLVSNERGTGKTSFLDLLRVMFSENAVIVGNDQMTSNFNTLISGKLIVGVDESNLADNKAFTEKLKFWSTAKRLPMEGKGKDAVMVDNFTKYILCSNNERRFIYASTEEVRFWVRKVPLLPSETRIGNIIPYFEEEMPAFMAYLNQRELWYNPDDKSKVDRMYFPPEMLHTQWLDNLLEAQRPRAEKKMREWLHQWFVDFEQQELLTTADKLQEAIGFTDKSFTRFDLEDLKRYIEENMKVRKYEGGKSKRFKFDILSNSVDYTTTMNTINIQGNGRPYVFKAADFLTEQEYKEIFVKKNEDVQLEINI